MDTNSEVIKFVEENDIGFIRLAFCDAFGMQKNISIMPSELPRALRHGISFDASAVGGFANVERSDLFLVPDCSTISILPWRPSSGRVMRMFCSVKNPDGSDCMEDGRAILRKVAERAARMGYICKIGPECEFYLFRTDEDETPTLIPMDQGGYCDIAPLDRGENVRREICLTLNEMGISPECSHHEQGPGQNEVDFRYSDALTAADNLVTFKSVVKSIAQQNGLFASFLPKPILDRSGNGMHINMSLSRDGKNLFQTGAQHSPEAESFIQGILDVIYEITAFLNPLTNSYARLGAYEAPQYITWSHQNRSQLIRIPASGGEYSRMELRSPDPACNPYLVFALLLHAGLDGIEQKRSLTPACNLNLFENEAYAKEHSITALPVNLEEALAAAEQSDFVRRVLPESLLSRYFKTRREQAEAHRNSGNPHQFDLDTFFRMI
jgi:glutamine synthetase